MAFIAAIPAAAVANNGTPSLIALDEDAGSPPSRDYARGTSRPPCTCLASRPKAHARQQSEYPTVGNHTDEPRAC